MFLPREHLDSVLADAPDSAGFEKCPAMGDTRVHRGSDCCVDEVVIELS